MTLDRELFLECASTDSHQGAHVWGSAHNVRVRCREGMALCLLYLGHKAIHQLNDFAEIDPFNLTQ